MGQRKLGIIISYVNLLLGTLINIFLTPFLINHLGDVDYSIYKVMQSLAGPLCVFNLGISTIVTRSIVKFRVEDDYSEKDKKNTLAMSIMVSVVMGICVIAVGFIIRGLIPRMYSNTYTVNQIQLSQEIFLIFVVATVLHILTDSFSGCIIGNEKYAVHSFISLGKNILKIIILTVMLCLGCTVKMVVLTDLIVAMSIFICSVVYSLCGLCERPKLYYFDKKQMIEFFSFSIAILLQTIVNQVNNNMDTMILGAYVNEKEIITMYSSALTIYMMFNSLVSVVAGFFLPKATQMISEKASGKELTDFVIKPGRFNAMVAVAVIFAFAVFGKNFIELWIGAKYLNAYYITLMLIIPVTIPLVQNVTIAILDASLKRIYRSIVLVLMAILNIVISIAFIKMVGFWGAAIGTVLSLLIGHGFMMNWYYAKTYQMEIVRMFREIFRGILPSGLISMFLCIPIEVLMPRNLLSFGIKCICFVIIYVGLLWVMGMREYEKNMIKGLLDKRNNRKVKY